MAEDMGRLVRCAVATDANLAALFDRKGQMIGHAADEVRFAAEYDRLVLQGQEAARDDAGFADQLRRRLDELDTYRKRLTGTIKLMQEMGDDATDLLARLQASVAEAAYLAEVRDGANGKRRLIEHVKG